MRKTLKLVAFFVYILTFIIAGSGALNYAFETSQHIYTIFGALNICVGIYIAYKYIKNNTIL